MLMSQAFEFIFEWDPTKAAANYKNHQIAFERAATVFNDPKALTIFDEESREDGGRWITLGLDVNMFFIVVHHTYQEKSGHSARVKIISARKASKKEITCYQEAC